MPPRRARTPESDVEMDASDSTPPVAGPSTPSKRRAAALRRVPDDDAEEEGEDEDEEEEEDDAEGEEDEEEQGESSEVDVVAEDDELEEEEEEVPPPPPPPPKRGGRKTAAAAPPSALRKAAPARGGGAASGLKIKLKMPATASTSTSASPSVPPEDEEEEEEEDAEGEADGMDVESEDDDDEEEETMPSKSGRLTARQAALANAGDKEKNDTPPEPELTSSRRKKKEMNEVELALKREETARKRKNLSEKRLEDEKAETINRLLRKQSRPRGRRNVLATADDAQSVAGSDAPGGSGAGDDDAGAEEREESPPTMWRWVSSARPVEGGAEGERAVALNVGVPVAVLPPAPLEERSGVTERPKAELCAVDGCGEKRKYRLVKDWTRGACGIGHLKALEASAWCVPPFLSWHSEAYGGLSPDTYCCLSCYMLSLATLLLFLSNAVYNPHSLSVELGRTSPRHRPPWTAQDIIPLYPTRTEHLRSLAIDLSMLGRLRE